ncbi:4-hydroxybenzoate octaprenyltransferase [Paracoccus aerodenitrificans]|uniref:4-hydroxybenzoate octaprenyltransferase n=1 Tax=Paracoccus aerodenitrificans TaxID=3017781 RepID=UPI0022F0E8C7|nr:4-hydroxybenzoate octaprenyltransferase [Paracoccus aerodenitrificans]WBU62829.1 4-hydroxybenzoate octaprenyltransferase [Paracoccus aerodenitrificans]
MKPAIQIPDAVRDAVNGNWVDNTAPLSWRPWLRLSRIDRPIGTWLLLLPCWWGIGLAMMGDRARWFDLWIAIACAIGAVAMRGAGCTWNDITDRDIDGSVDRTRKRPIPSGQVTVRGALIWMGAQALIGLAMLLTLGGAAIWLGVLSLLPVAIYPFAKRFTWWPQVFLGIAFNWGVMLAYAAHRGQLDMAPVIAWFGGIAWTVFYDTIYAHQDREYDALIGVKSTARLFGENTRTWLIVFGILAVLLLAMAIGMTGAEGASWYLAMAGLAGFAGHLVWQLLTLDLDDADIQLMLFRSNRDTGLILVGFLAIAGIV